MAIRVVIVDDTESLRALLRRHVEGTADMEVVGEAANGLEAVEVTRDTDPDAVILDVEMPVMDGLEALAGLKQATPGAKIVMFSSRSEPGTRARAVAGGVDGFFRKGETKTADVVDYVLHLFDDASAG